MLGKYCAAAYAYGFLRSAVGPKLEPGEYITDRMGKIMMYTVIAPVALPSYIYLDMKAIEHIVRKMPGNVERFPFFSS